MRNLTYKAMIAGLVATALGCDKPVESFSLLGASSAFKQSVAYVPRKIDILWVVDSSGSMYTSQTNLANNFTQFINEFQTKGFDFSMAVTHSGAYYDYYYGTTTRSRFCTGPVVSTQACTGTGTSYSGINVMNTLTSNLTSVFTKNVKVGTNGTGDERAFSSFEKALSNSANTGFRRPGAYLAVIIVSDEDDFSHNDWGSGTSSYFSIFDQNDARLTPISYFQDVLNTNTGSTAETARDNYAVHTISVLDTVCRASTGTYLSQRYQQMATATGGISASICAPMSDVLTELGQKTVELASVFQLEREPWPNTINVTVNGVNVAQSTDCGWSYTESTWTIRFHGAACVPPADADVRIFFEPKTPQI